MDDNVIILYQKKLEDLEKYLHKEIEDCEKRMDFKNHPGASFIESAIQNKYREILQFLK